MNSNEILSFIKNQMLIISKVHITVCRVFFTNISAWQRVEPILMEMDRQKKIGHEIGLFAFEMSFIS